jgi:hypothetical protein
MAINDTGRESHQACVGRYCQNARNVGADAFCKSGGEGGFEKLNVEHRTGLHGLVKPREKNRLLAIQFPLCLIDLF